MKTKNLNLGQPNEFERERLVMLLEECAELQKEICKALRHGLDARHPSGVGMTNRYNIAHELGDVFGLADILTASGVIEAVYVADSRRTKPDRIERWVYHEPPKPSIEKTFDCPPPRTPK